MPHDVPNPDDEATELTTQEVLDHYETDLRELSDLFDADPADVGVRIVDAQGTVEVFVRVDPPA